MSNSFKLTITPNVTIGEILDYPYYGKTYDLDASIDPTWFKQTKITQENDFTTLEVDFSISETEAEIHDCFLPDLLWVLEDLGKHNGKKYIVNSEPLSVDCGKNITCVVKNGVLFINDKEKKFESLFEDFFDGKKLEKNEVMV